jgi:molecular chaperone DnaJ
VRWLGWFSKVNCQKHFLSLLTVFYCRTATTLEIKASYRRLALALHPDVHDGCDIKTKAFKEASEAYNILSDNNRRREYDMANGVTPTGWHNKNRRRAPPVNYRSVYAPHAPPDGKWHDAQRHYDMHYGDGMFQDAFKRAKERGEFDYHSPLGKGFSFESTQDRKSRHGQSSYAFRNPYSKADQLPAKEYEYDITNGNEAKTILRRKKGVVDKMHERRSERQEEQKGDQAVPIIPGQRMYEPLNQQSESCSIM